MMSQFQDSGLGGSVHFYCCSWQEEESYVVLSCHVRWLFYEPAHEESY